MVQEETAGGRQGYLPAEEGVEPTASTVPAQILAPTMLDTGTTVEDEGMGGHRKVHHLTMSVSTLEYIGITNVTTAILYV